MRALSEPLPPLRAAAEKKSPAAGAVQLSGLQATSAASDAATEASAADVILRCLFQAWHECMPADMSRQPDVQALECLVMLLESVLMLLRSLGIPGALP